MFPEARSAVFSGSDLEVSLPWSLVSSSLPRHFDGHLSSTLSGGVLIQLAEGIDIEEEEEKKEGEAGFSGDTTTDIGIGIGKKDKRREVQWILLSIREGDDQTARGYRVLDVGAAARDETKNQGRWEKLGMGKSKMGGFGVEEDERMWILRDEGEEVGGMDDGEDRKSNDGKGDGGDGGEEKQERSMYPVEGS
ncbi:hypothetical protein K435DRAFT_939152 [Dendrothele bispora CBS 962.96]|uniref:Uncharacterized protein n=1 Tax=Dendrothele bispora (strain CBS 962.96) TaxID=1314807 RepID=A0A4S8KXH9_DENBC|nr:hypothetical protein K435DRAFT_939152 [Dendrothele bispora CBS 962.96]